MSPRGGTHDDDEDADERAGRVRLDKWLWAARFYKTRALAAEAIDGGKVEVGGERAKRSRLIAAGDRVAVRHGAFETTLVVRGASIRRGSATVAAELYEETAESKAARERIQLQMKLARVTYDFAEGKPDKKQRREIDKWKGKQ
ncbi:MAG: RNA-binding protein [Gemmatimonadetes bacterium]|nr:RNA-binding protein [Gemmatimonadota bacterium]